VSDTAYSAAGCYRTDIQSRSRQSALAEPRKGRTMDGARERETNGTASGFAELLPGERRERRRFAARARASPSLGRGNVAHAAAATSPGQAGARAAVEREATGRALEACMPVQPVRVKKGCDGRPA